MAQAVLMPQVGQDIETAVLVEWKVQCGDTVKATDVIALVESDKATFEVEAMAEGVILERVLEEGAEGKVLAPIAYIGKAGESVKSEEPQELKTAEPEPSVDSSQTATAPPTRKDRIIAAPAARRLAKEHGIDLATVKGTGPQGRIVKDDVLAVVGQELLTPAPGPDDDIEEIPFSKLRSRIASRLTQSKQNIPHFYLYVDVDMTEAMTWRKAHNQESDTKISVTDMIVFATARALRTYPRLNAHVAENKLILHKHIHVGLAVSVEDGLVVPVIDDTDTLSLDQTALVIRTSAQGARDGLLKAQSVGTFTISNLGMYEVGMFLPIINPPECAILGVGAISARPCIKHGGIAIAQMMTLALACDHRAVDGAYAAEFLQDLKQKLEQFEVND